MANCRLTYAYHAGIFIWPTLQIAHFHPHPWGDELHEIQVCLWWLRGGLILRLWRSSNGNESRG